MANCHRNNVGSLVLNHHHPTKSSAAVAGHFRLWNSLSAGSFRRIIFDALSCGGATSRRHHHTDSSVSTARSDSDSEDRNPRRNATRSEKLSDLLSMADSDADAETKKKEEALEDLKRLVAELRPPAEDDSPAVRRAAAASALRRLAREDSEIRVTLAMLGAIPPLVAMLDSEDLDSQVASLYALLNLGIGNDA